MEKKIIDLEIVDELEGSGVDAIALVDSPAIEKNFMYFKAEQFVEPKSGESQDEYVGRCVPVLIDEGKDQDQAVAICISTYENMGKLEFAKVSFDWDDTLSTSRGKKLFEEYKKKGDTLYIITARRESGKDILQYANEMGIPDSRIFATGSNLEKVRKVKDLGITKHIDNNADVIQNLAGIGQKFEIDTAGLAPYTNQTGPLKRKAVLASVEELAVGDAVSWKTADQNPRGRITEIVTGAKKVPGVDFEIQGTEEDPGYIIEIYEELDGKWEPTGKYVGRKADSILKNVELAETDRTVGTYGFTKLMFADEDKKELVGPVAVPDMEIPRKDKEGNIYFVRFSKDVVRKMAEKFMREQRLSDNNIQHKDDINAGSYVFESWVVETPEDKANTVYGLDVPVGTWMVKMRVVNLETWAKVKSGELRGFSLQGNFLSQDEYESYLKDKKTYEDLLKFVSSI